MSALTLYGVRGKMTRRLAGVVIGTQGLAVFFGALVARALAATDGSQVSRPFLLVGSLLAVLCIVDAALMRRPWGITVGWVLQIATLACAFILPVMLVVGLLFGALWLTALVQGHAMDVHTRRVDAQWHASQASAWEGSAWEGSASEGSASEGSAPEASAPEASAPEASAPEASASEQSAQHPSQSERSAPEG